MNNNNNKNISFLSSLSRRATRIAHNGASSDARSRARAIPGDDDGGARLRPSSARRASRSRGRSKREIIHVRVKYPHDRACARNTASSSSSSSSERKAISRSTTIAAKCRARARRWNNHQRNVAVDGSGLARGVSLARYDAMQNSPRVASARPRDISRATTATATRRDDDGGGVDPRRRSEKANRRFVCDATRRIASPVRPFVRSSVRSTSWREVTRSTAFVELALR